MAATPKRGATESPKAGVYRDPVTDGVRDTKESNPYRNSPVGPIDITGINYIPYGGVYEREGDFPTDRVATGGAYEQYHEPEPEIVYIYIQSTLYPVLFEDDTDGSGNLLAVALQKISVDNSETSVTFTGGTLTPVLITYSGLPESVESSATLSGGTLDTVLLQYSMLPESTETLGHLDSGSLVVALIRYTQWIPEDTESGQLITGGTLA
jgi:hypothetical protein